MHKIGWWLGCTDKRHKRAGRNDCPVIGHFGKPQGVSRGYVCGHIAENAGQTDDVNALVCEGHVDGHRIVNAGVGVDYDFMFHQNPI
jgi:hypothetical protein